LVIDFIAAEHRVEIGQGRNGGAFDLFQPGILLRLARHCRFDPGQDVFDSRNDDGRISDGDAFENSELPEAYNRISERWQLVYGELI
jgi:hypothetical protein